VFTGVYCETERSAQISEPSTSNSGVIIAVSIIILAIVVALLIYAYWFIWRTRRLKGQYKPSQMEQNWLGDRAIPLDKMLVPNYEERII